METLNNIRRLAAVAFIALALCAIVYHSSGRLAVLRSDSRIIFMDIECATGSSGPVETPIGVMNMCSSWAGRVLSLRMGHWFTKSCVTGDLGINAAGNFDVDQFVHRSGLYCALWLALTFLVYLIAFRENALIPIFGTFAGVMFAYSPGIADRVFSWDMPSLFFYSLFVCLVVRRRLLWLIPVLPVAMLFKETVILLPIAFLFVREPWRRRLTLFAIAVGAVALTRLVTVLITGAESGGGFNPRILMTNLRMLVTLQCPIAGIYKFPPGWSNHPLLANAGLLVAFWLTPGRGEHTALFRTIFILFAGLISVFGLIVEYRIWFELIPLCLYPFYCDRVEPLRPEPEVA